MARDDPQLKLRLPAELKERVEEAARINKRSVNAEIVARLEMTFPEHEAGQPTLFQKEEDKEALDAWTRHLREIERRIKALEARAYPKEK